MVAFWMNARPSQTVLKMPLVLTLLTALSVFVHLTSMEMVESVELDAMVRQTKFCLEYNLITQSIAFQCSYIIDYTFLSLYLKIV